MPTCASPHQEQQEYQPLENYGVIGNLHTVALVGMHGSIDWCCFPHFDSPSIFGALLDIHNGGYFKISPRIPTRNKQFYLSDSNILITRFLTDQGVAEIVDFMPVADKPEDNINDHQLYRIVRGVRGHLPFQLECFPAFNYGQSSHRTSRHKNGVVFESKRLFIGLQAPLRLSFLQKGVHAAFSIHEGQMLTFTMRHVENGRREDSCSLPMTGNQALEATLHYWQSWISQIRYQGRWREMVTRSALVLKMLTFAPTGAIVASPTTSLPERIGGPRNWDYRYIWIRDASFTLYAFLRLGFKSEARAFMNWLQARLAELKPSGALQVAYGLHGEHRLTERCVNHLEGYKKSFPVRIGNAAHAQTQLDIYGELMDAVYLYNKYGSPISYELWKTLRKLLGFVCRHWQEKDHGIWEVRDRTEHFVYSKVMCWVALDRGLRLAQKRSFPADWNLWIKTRDKIYEQVMRKGWDANRSSFIQYYGSSALDASALVMPLVKFLSPTDPRMVSTVARIRETLVSDSLVRRYKSDRSIDNDRGGKEGTFSMCTFWYAEILARSGQLREARWTFEKMLGYANHLGLYSEEIGPSGQQLGNFPQALTHLALISAAYNLDKALDMKP
jgi:GH15 family glucan-1,4-alpha-glucosidase